MTQKEIEDFLQFFKRLPDPKHQPKQFEYYVKLYKHAKGLKK